MLPTVDRPLTVDAASDAASLLMPSSPFSRRCERANA